ncbi:MAG TPA: hypothetical protein VLG15_06300 [Thermoanaerobaculia bacterium]|nr:hypothetical protein [Thermoanaerobaculia bacterium]
MQKNRGWWKKTLAAGLISSALFAGTAFAAGDSRMQSQKAMTSRRAATESPRVVNFKTERTDSWLCINVSPFFCSAVPTAAPPTGTTATSVRGRR